MEKVRSGEAVSIKASTWNSFVDAANFAKTARQNRLGDGLKSGVGFGIILVKNCEERTYDRFAALSVTGVCVTADANEDEFVSCAPVLQGSRVTDERVERPYVILQEPLEAGAVGRAMVMGVTPAKVKVNDSEDGYAVPKAGSDGSLESASTGVARILWKGSGSGAQWCLLQLGGAGGGAGEDKALMCKVGSGSAQAGYQVTVYPNGRSDQSSSYSALMFLPDVALDADLPSGTWVIGHKCSVASTGGNEK